MSTGERLNVDQALHGYDNGHRLITASRDLPASAQRTLLLLSDWSGSGRVKRFDEYVTGYPLPDANAYAFAKTWYANEMPRPGCVWTQTLLISFPDVAKLPSLRPLLSLFHRPAGTENHARYSAPLEVSAETANPPVAVSDAEVVTVVTGLYGRPDQALFLAASSADDYLDVTLLVWAQQWPRLRRAFSFCTGAISSRAIYGKPLDLQIIPIERWSHLQRSQPHEVFINRMDRVGPSAGESASAPQSDQTWIGAVARDLMRGEATTKLRKELWWFGADVPSSRASLPQLVNALSHARLAGRDGQSLSSLIAETAWAFPQPSSAARLKLALFKKRPSERHLLPQVAESQLLLNLLSTDMHAAFEYDELRVHPRVATLWEQDRAAGRSLLAGLLEADRNPEGERTLDWLLATVTVEDLVALTPEQLNPRLSRRLLRRNPRLLETAALWQLPISLLRETFLPVLRENLPLSVDWHRVAWAMLEGNPSVGGELLLEHLGREALARLVLDGLHKGAFHSWSGLPRSWVDAVRDQPDVVRDWITSRKPSLNSTARVLSLLDPNDQGLRRSGPLPWIDLASRADVEPDNSAKLRVMVFSLALALWNPGEGADRIVLHSFQLVHDALERNRLSHRATRWLSPHLQTSRSLFAPRDQAELLRRTMVDCFIKYDWPERNLRHAIRRTETLDKVLRYCEKRYGHRCILKSHAEGSESE